MSENESKNMTRNISARRNEVETAPIETKLELQKVQRQRDDERQKFDQKISEESAKRNAAEDARQEAEKDRLETQRQLDELSKNPKPTTKRSGFFGPVKQTWDNIWLNDDESPMVVSAPVPAPAPQPSGVLASGGLGGWASARPGEQRTLKLAGVKCVFSFIPKGEFLMGSPTDEEERGDYETQHKVILTEDFWLGSYPVTQKLYKALTGEDPSDFQGENRPVECVSWNDINDLIKKLNSLGYAPEGWRFDFPTEAQWEYACRAGTTTPFSFGSTLNGDNANCDGNNYPYRTSKGRYLGRTTDVGSYPPNAWNLYDMHGNVWEWCRDNYGDYASGTVTDPCRAADFDRVLRGGSWSHGAESCRSARRSYCDPSDRRLNCGARLALVRQ